MVKLMRHILYLILSLALYACQAPARLVWWQPSVQEASLPQSYDAVAAPRSALPAYCNSQLGYQPDTSHLDHTPVREVRVNIHWINNTAKTANLDDWKAVNYAKGMIHAANYALENNRAMWLPHDNQTPVLPTRFRYVLTGRPSQPDDDGIYFHYDDSLYHYVHIGRRNANYSSRKVIQKYGIQLDTVLNIFVMPYHLDSMANPKFKAEQVGVALGDAVKIAGPWVRMWEKNYESFWETRGNINHEIGHIFGLNHAWNTNDGCDDTPRHDQRCFNRDSGPGCDTLASNNVMDYNALQLAWSPCQIGSVHQRMADERARQRRFLQPNWCELHDDRHIVIQDTVVWSGAKDLEGHLTIAPGGHLTIRCRVSMPAEGRITVRAGGTLVLEDARLHNACGEEWMGIQIEDTASNPGQVIRLGSTGVEDAVFSK